MEFPKKQMDGKSDAPATRSNNRRLVIIIVVVFIAVLSFFAGRFSHHRPYSSTDNGISNTASDPSGREGIPPDSLQH